MNETLKQLSALIEKVEKLQTQTDGEMSQEDVEAAIKEVSQTILAVQQLQKELVVDEAINSAQVVESADDDSPFK
jgi:hypothetical protein